MTSNSSQITENTENGKS
uniref:Uncharacterized protein n=1 Tax=Anguilla anguilla TaxID=7936 RepID=A0A0E9PXS4_ANGAN